MLISIDNDEERAWPQTQAVLRATGWEAPAAFPGQGSLLGFRADGRARMLAHESRSEEELAAALIAATVPEAEPEDLSAPPDLEEAIPEAAPEEAGWAWDARSGESGPVPGRDPAAEWALALNRDLFSAGPLGCALAWICLLVVAGIATWSGRALYRAHAVSGEGGRFVLLLFGLLAFLAGYGVYKALAPLTARLAARTAGHRLTWLGWGLAAGLPLWLFLLAALVRQDGDILAEARELLGLFR
jgi:hypothetical protein